jgi:hypothetical protein
MSYVSDGNEEREWEKPYPSQPSRLIRSVEGGGCRGAVMLEMEASEVVVFEEEELLFEEASEVMVFSEASDVEGRSVVIERCKQAPSRHSCHKIR